METLLDILQYVAWWHCTHATLEFTIEPYFPFRPFDRDDVQDYILIIHTYPTSISYEVEL